MALLGTNLYNLGLESVDVSEYIKKDTPCCVVEGHLFWYKKYTISIMSSSGDIRVFPIPLIQIREMIAGEKVAYFSNYGRVGRITLSGDIVICNKPEPGVNYRFFPSSKDLILATSIIRSVYPEWIDRIYWTQTCLYGKHCDATYDNRYRIEPYRGCEYARLGPIRAYKLEDGMTWIINDDTLQVSVKPVLYDTIRFITATKNLVTIYTTHGKYFGNPTDDSLFKEEERPLHKKVDDSLRFIRLLFED